MSNPIILDKHMTITEAHPHHRGLGYQPQCPLCREVDRIEREAFEHAAFQQYFISTIKRTDDPIANANQIHFVNEGLKDKAKFLAKNANGAYADDTLNAAWWAWLKRANLPTLLAKIEVPA